ncbi:MAG: hypothetical protein A3I92_01970 [Candidatus Yanofskybacteria bacterium RIFCSPLOWO2_02_FULL_43_10b]|uniref:Uncharacterized protein n=1 Tax=Candidatus Yanofskybacteria bacterium RIFCSPLOWO2_02_FULL_43_10b TaxID=1802704 RepID=A0A1F8H3K3_9BACT|nr:MAG: hypothetical protein A3I92_01970 [Candidatus Yanofskybacteria bacterium RIFCSPLOWO2_02_FULL_43_10b]
MKLVKVTFSGRSFPSSGKTRSVKTVDSKRVKEILYSFRPVKWLFHLMLRMGWKSHLLSNPQF